MLHHLNFINHIPTRLLGDRCGLYASSNFVPEEEDCALQSVGLKTTDTTWIAGRWLGGDESDTPCFTVIDTPGIGDYEGEDADYRHFYKVAEMVKKIWPIDAFVLVMNGKKTRVPAGLLDRLRFFAEFFGDQFWRSTVIEVSFWGHSKEDARKRERNEMAMEALINQQLKQKFPSISHIPTFFIDPVYEEDFSDQRAKQMQTQETGKLWSFMTNNITPGPAPPAIPAPPSEDYPAYGDAGLGEVTEAPASGYGAPADEGSGSGVEASGEYGAPAE